MIPKKIHYIWVGWKELPELEKKCVESWNKYLPGYELCLRNESTFDIESHPFVKQAYDAKKYAFVSDYIRIWALYKFWWIYLDTDVEVIKNLDKFLDSKWFWWFEWKDLITTWVIACEKNNPFIKEILNRYDNHEFDPNNLIPNPIIVTNVAKEKFWFYWWRQEKVNLKEDVYEIYPENYFCPKFSRKKCLSRKDCYVIHHFTWSWMNQSKFKASMKKKIIKILKSLWLYSIILDLRNRLHSK